MPRLRALQELSGHKDRVWYVCWHPSGKVLATCSSDKTIRIWGPQYVQSPADEKNTGVEPDEHESMTNAKNAVDNSGVLDVANPRSFLPSSELKWVCKFTLTEGHSRAIRSLAWSPDGRLLVSCGFDGVVNVWQLEDGDFVCVASLEGHENEVKSVAWSSNGQYLATCGRDKTVWIWEAVGADNDGEADAEVDFECESVMHSHTQDVKKVHWHPHDDVVISTSYDDTIKFYRKDGDDWTCYDTLYGHTSTAWAADMHPSGKVLVSCSADKTLRFWAHDVDAQPPAQLWKPIRLCEGQHDGPIYDVKWNQFMPVLIATACGDNGVRVFRVTPSADKILDSDAATPLVGGDLFDKLKSDFNVNLDAEEKQGHRRDCNAVAWFPSSVTPMLASAGDDGVVKLWLYEADENLEN